MLLEKKKTKRGKTDKKKKEMSYLELRGEGGAAAAFANKKCRLSNHLRFDLPSAWAEASPPL